MKPKITLPSPKLLLVEARGSVGRDAPLNVDVYASVIGELRDGKNYSFGKIAEWLGERVGREINKGIVYRVYHDWRDARANEEPYFDEPEELSDDEQYARAVLELEQEILNFAMERTSALGSGGYTVNEAIENVLYRLKQTQADEKAAREADEVASAQDKEGKSK